MVMSYRRHTLAVRDPITLACPLTAAPAAQSVVNEQIDAKSITTA
jgi:hypothetical protein